MDNFVLIQKHRAMSHFIISTENGRLVFFITYNLAILLAMSLYILWNVRRGSNAAQTLLKASSGLLLFLICLSLPLTNPANLVSWLSESSTNGNHQRNFIGGMTGLFAGIGIASLWFRTRKSGLDGFAMALPLGMAVHRIGCLFTGCCFGRPASLPWAICYSASSQAFHSHPAYALETGSPVSMPVHPVQLYEIILCLMLAAFLWHIVKYERLKGNLLLISIIIYGAIWFGCEFFRDSAGVYSGGEKFAGLRLIQWIILGSESILIPVLAARLGSKKGSKASAPEGSPGEHVLFGFAAFIVAGSLVAGRRLELMDRLTLLTVLVPAVAMTLWKTLSKLTIPGFRLTSVSLILAAIILMSQVPAPSSPGEKTRYTELSVRAMWNSYTNTVQKAVRSYNSCGGTSFVLGPEVQHRHNSLMVGFSFSDLNRKTKSRLSGYYLNLIIGMDEIKGSKPDYSDDQFSIGLNPGVQFNWRYFGLRSGLWLGWIRIAGITTDVRKVGDFQGDYMGLYVFPQIGIRAGVPEYCYLGLHFADAMAGQLNPVLFQGGIGTGFGKLYCSSLEAGFSSIGPYVHGIIRLSKNIQMTAYLSNSFGTNMFNSFDNTYLSAGFIWQTDIRTVKKHGYR
jgi:phosphatidylglycerol:prolipoprotein diacylglycerol transferase